MDLPTERDVQWGDFGEDSVAGGTGAGDTNGDGLADVIVYSLANPVTGLAFVFTNTADGVYLTSDADGILWDEDLEHESCVVAAAGDTNGDGYDDVLVGGRLGEEGPDHAGYSHLVLGPVSGLSEFDSAAAATMVATSDWSYGDIAVAGAGDVNGDGLDDLTIGSPNIHDDGPGSAYIVFSPVSGTFSLADSDRIFHGDGDDNVGSAVAGAGDIDGDGLADVLIYGPGDDDGGTDAGAAWLLLGASLR